MRVLANLSILKWRGSGVGEEDEAPSGGAAPLQLSYDIALIDSFMIPRISGAGTRM